MLGGIACATLVPAAPWNVALADTSTDASTSSGPVVASPSVLPATGIGTAGPDVRVGDLGTQLGLPPSGQPQSGKPSERAARAWSVTPSLGLTEEYASGGNSSGSSASNQLITLLQPSLLASGDTTRLQGNLSYTPQILLYSQASDQNQIDQNFEARALATLQPQTLFLDLRGSGAVQSVAAGQAPNQTGTLAAGNTTQDLTVAITPYALHRFGAWGTGELGATLGRTTQTALTGGQTSLAAQQLAALAASSNQTVTTASAHAAFTTGEAFARFNDAFLGQLTSFAGSGVLSGAYRDTVSFDNGYAVTRTITVLATLGWERIHYAGSSPIFIDDAIWNVGIRLHPNADSTITIRYGHQDGLNSLTVNADYQPSARTRVYVRYSTGLNTQAEQLQNALATSDLDSQGSLVDHASGAPLVGANNAFGVQNSLYKTSLASVTGVLLHARDSLSISINSQTQTLISASNAVGLANGSSRGTYLALTWTHALRPNLQSTVYGQYGVQDGGENGIGLAAHDQQVMVLSASMSYALSPTLSGQARFSYNKSYGSQVAEGAGQAIAAGGQSLMLLSLVKSF